jgi:hypothetical protein
MIPDGEGSSDMRTRGGIMLVLAVSAIGATGARQPQPATATRVDLERLGPQVGTRLPDFTLRDQHSSPRALTSLLGPKGALIVFFRSADW